MFLFGSKYNNASFRVGRIKNGVNVLRDLPSIQSVKSRRKSTQVGETCRKNTLKFSHLFSTIFSEKHPNNLSTFSPSTTFKFYFMSEVRRLRSLVLPNMYEVRNENEMSREGLAIIIMQFLSLSLSLFPSTPSSIYSIIKLGQTQVQVPAALLLIPCSIYNIYRGVLCTD